jgi:succinoglycan biosynthesis protein ExoO
MNQHNVMNRPPTRDPADQVISVIMANLNGADYLRHAIRSVLGQTHTKLELLIADDGSTDDSCRIIHEESARDPRIMLLQGSDPQGPAAARNRALAKATGDWIAIVDSDDIIHPERFERLLHTALALTSDMIADDIIFFGDDPIERNKTLLQDFHLTHPLQIDAVTLVTGGLQGNKTAPLGYLKPMIRRSALAGLRFDESLLIDEDHAFYLSLVLSGAVFTLVPDGMYLYRRHAASASHRLSTAKLRLMIAAQQKLLQRVSGDQYDLTRAVAQRLRETKDQLDYSQVREAVTSGHTAKAIGQLARHPKCLLFLLQSLSERANRRLRRPAAQKKPLQIILSDIDHAPRPDTPDARIIKVPQVPDTGWMPSAAATWARLAQLSCEYDLDIVALDRAGHYALGLVPNWRSARVIHPNPSSMTGRLRPVSHAEGT